MNRKAKNHIRNVFQLTITAFLLAGAFCLTPVSAAQTAPAGPADLLQFMSAGHVLGFEASGVYVVSGGAVVGQANCLELNNIPLNYRPELGIYRRF